jgi:hypothetical protein
MRGTRSLAVSAVSLLAVLCSAKANAATVQWQSIVGNPIPSITSAVTRNTVGGVLAGTDPWSTQGGSAEVDLTTRHVIFSVKGLVFGAETVVGTPGPVTEVKGALVCGPGAAKPAVFYTPAVPLSAQGAAAFSGFFASSTAGCSATNVAFLIVNANNNRWIAYGAVRTP